MEVLGVDDFEILIDDPEWHLRLDKMPRRDLINLFERDARLAVDRIHPTMVAIPAPSFNQDHEAVFKAALTACRPHLATAPARIQANSRPRDARAAAAATAQASGSRANRPGQRSRPRASPAPSSVRTGPCAQSDPHSEPASAPRGARNERVRVSSDWVLKRLGELAEVDIAMLFDGDYELRLPMSPASSWTSATALHSQAECEAPLPREPHAAASGSAPEKRP